MSLKDMMEEMAKADQGPKKPQEPAQPLGPRKGFGELHDLLTGETPKTQGGKPSDPTGPV